MVKATGIVGVFEGSVNFGYVNKDIYGKLMTNELWFPALAELHNFYAVILLVKSSRA